MASIRRLPDGELIVMQAVWELTPPICRGDLERSLLPTHSMALTTLLTQLSRLVGKGFLYVQKEGRSNTYIPIISRQEYLAAQSHSFVKRLCGGSMSVFASALCDSGLTREELEELRSLLEEGI